MHAVDANACAEPMICLHQNRTVGDFGRQPIVVDMATSTHGDTHTTRQKRDGAAAVRIVSPYAIHATARPVSFPYGCRRTRVLSDRRGWQADMRRASRLAFRLFQGIKSTFGAPAPDVRGTLRLCLIAPILISPLRASVVSLAATARVLIVP